MEKQYIIDVFIQCTAPTQKKKDVFRNVFGKLDGLVDHDASEA